MIRRQGNKLIANSKVIQAYFPEISASKANYLLKVMANKFKHIHSVDDSKLCHIHYFTPRTEDEAEKVETFYYRQCAKIIGITNRVFDQEKNRTKVKIINYSQMNERMRFDACRTGKK